jgi:hypothetical protein
VSHLPACPAGVSHLLLQSAVKEDKKIKQQSFSKKSCKKRSGPMWQWLRKSYIKGFLVYNKMQIIFLTIFVLGFLDLIIYSDVVYFLFLIPEVTWPVFVVLIAIGVYKWKKIRKTKKQERDVN